MEMRRLGRTDVHVSELCPGATMFGAMSDDPATDHARGVR
jgi:aryl-alcohol dehydrogenase-like predicted oxidoreductase